MSAAALPLDTYAEAVEAWRGTGGAAAQRLVVVAFIDTWAPPAHATAVSLEAARAHVHGFASIFVVDATAEWDAAQAHGIVTTPSILFFWDGQLVTVRREALSPPWDEDKYVGYASEEQLIAMIRHARDCCVNHQGGRLIVNVDI